MAEEADPEATKSSVSPPFIPKPATMSSGILCTGSTRSTETSVCGWCRSLTSGWPTSTSGTLTTPGTRSIASPGSFSSTSLPWSSRFTRVGPRIPLAPLRLLHQAVGTTSIILSTTIGWEEEATGREACLPRPDPTNDLTEAALPSLSQITITTTTISVVTTGSQLTVMTTIITITTTNLTPITGTILPPTGVSEATGAGAEAMTGVAL